MVFAFEAGYAGVRPYVGLRWKNPEEIGRLTPAVLENLVARLGVSRAAERWWPWWQHLERADLDGVDGTDFSALWAAMNDSRRFAPLIVNRAVMAAEALTAEAR